MNMIHAALTEYKQQTLQKLSKSEQSSKKTLQKQTSRRKTDCALTVQV
jgi:hypothetical protein